MRFEVKERGSKEFYDEMLYVITYYKKFIKNPKRKAWQYTKYLILYMIISAAMCAGFAALYVFDREWYSLVFVGMFLLILIFTMILFVNVQKRIKMFMNDKSDKVIEITDEAISYSSDTLNLKMNKADIAVIVINKNSICVLPKVMTTYALSISNDYLDEFLQGAKESGYDELIVNNKVNNKQKMFFGPVPKNKFQKPRKTKSSACNMSNFFIGYFQKNCVI